MRNFSLIKKSSVIKTLKEPKKKKATFNWQRFFFALLLGSFLFYVGKRVYKGVALIIGNGQIELTKQAIQFTDDIRVLSLQVSEGDSVVVGDTLFLYRHDASDEETTAMINVDDPIDWLVRDKLNTKKQIALKKIEHSRTQEQLDFKTQEIKHQKDMIILGVDNRERHLSAMEESVIDLKSAQGRIKKEILYLRKHLNELRKQERNIRSTEIRKIKHINAILAYTAPISGVIGQININKNEVCYEKQDVMTIHQISEISIKAFFNTDEVSNLSRGDRVVIHFPDGSQSTGQIKNFYISTYTVPVEFQKKYEPVERNVVVEIIPIVDEEINQWLKFYKMNVEVVKHRFTFTL